MIEHVLDRGQEPAQHGEDAFENVLPAHQRYIRASTRLPAHDAAIPPAAVEGVELPFKTGLVIVAGSAVAISAERRILPPPFNEPLKLVRRFRDRRRPRELTRFERFDFPNRGLNFICQAREPNFKRLDPFRLRVATIPPTEHVPNI